MLKTVLVGILTLSGLGSLSAQSNQQIDVLLGQSPARLDSIAYLVLASAGLVPEDAEPSAAFDAAMAAGFVAGTKGAGDPVSIEELSYLVMKVLKVGGGWQWSLFPNPRAAYQELAYKEFINTTSGPGRIVAGDEVVRTLEAVLALKGGRN